jgi:transcriptional regulator with GAF, ATPase, and Fis domain
MEITNVIGEDPLLAKKLHLRKMKIEVRSGSSQGFVREFAQDVLRIGSQEGRDLRLKDATVSRLHAEIVRTRQGILLRDLDSTNGTFVGDVRVREVYLGDQRTFMVGKTELFFSLCDEVIDIVPTESTEFEGLVGCSVALREVFSVLDRVSRTDLTVLVRGETGTGKELVCRALHKRSRRSRAPFIVFDCAAVAKGLIESELFGHQRGAFTGAVGDRTGVFEQANGGTLFIDELGELPLDLQPTLLRVLEQRQVRRVGSSRWLPVDVRVVVATNRNLRDMVESKLFREDLYYRLGVVELVLPPLRKRIEDLPLLAKHFLATAPMEHSIVSISPPTMEIFQDYHWPGNIREFRNIILRALPFCDGSVLELSVLPESMSLSRAGFSSNRRDDKKDENSPEKKLSLREARENILGAFERQYLSDLLKACAGSISEAARVAGVDRKTISRMLKRHDLR